MRTISGGPSPGKPGRFSNGRARNAGSDGDIESAKNLSVVPGEGVIGSPQSGSLEPGLAARLQTGRVGAPLLELEPSVGDSPGRIRRVHVSQMINDRYDLIGGRRTLTAAVESFYRRVLAEENLSQFFERSDMGHVQARQSMFLTMLLGGRVVYTGRDIGAAHAQARERGLSDAQFDAFMAHFRAVLVDLGVKGEKQERVLNLLEEKRSSVVKG